MPDYYNDPAANRRRYAERQRAEFEGLRRRRKDPRWQVPAFAALVLAVFFAVLLWDRLLP